MATTYLLSDKARTIMDVLQNTVGQDLDAPQLAEETDLPCKTVNAVATALARRGLVCRVEVEGRDRKIIRLTEEGEVFDIDTPKEG